MTDSTALFATRAPVNAQSAKSLSGGGLSWEAKLSRSGVFFEVCPPLREIGSVLFNNPAFQDLTGRRAGRFTVQGLAADNQAGGARWAVRCDCGGYSVRRTKSLLQTNPRDLSCPKCDYVAHLRREDRARQIGRWEDGTPYQAPRSEMQFARVSKP